MSRQPSLQSQNFTTTSASGSCVFLPSPIQPAPVMGDGMIVSPTSGLPTPIMAPRRASSLAMAFGGGVNITVPTAATPVAPQPADHSTNTSTASATLVPGGKATTTTTTKRRYSHNPYATSSASSNASDSSAPSTPLMGSFAGVPMSYMPSNGADAMGVDSSMPQHHHRVGSTFSTGVHLAPSHLQGHAQHGVDYFGYGPATQPLPAPISVPAGVVGGYGAAAASSVLASPTVAGCGVSIGVGLPQHQRVHQMLHGSAGGSGVGVVGGNSGLAAALPPSAGPSSAAQSHLASPQAPMLQSGSAAPGGHQHHHHGHAMPHPHSHHHGAHGAHPTSVSGPSTVSSAAAAGAMPVPTAMSIKAALEQFDPLRGQLPAAACTQRGRHAIVAVLRTMDPAATAACVAELKGAWGILIQDPNGCHVARTLVECIGDAQAAELASALTREEVHTMAAVSQHARRVLQALFERHRPAALQPIVEHIAAGAVGLAMTQQGCIGVMRVLEYADASQRAMVLGALTPSLAQLAMDPFGNYVVQTIASSVERDVACAAMAHAFRGHWVRLACNKFASNVLEKVLRIATPIVRDALLEDICYSPAGLGVVIQDSFGNFVLQAVIESCQSGAELRRLGERIRPMLASSPYGHKIESKLKSKRLPMDM